MSYPKQNTQVLPFEKVLKQVSVAIQQATNKASTNDKQAFTNRLWCEWLKSEVLS